MAYSPCPQCQTSKQFDSLFTRMSERKALDSAGFLVASRDSAGYVIYQCSKVPDHKYLTEDAAIQALKNAGYGR